MRGSKRLLIVENSAVTFLTHRAALARFAAEHGFRVSLALPKSDREVAGRLGPWETWWYELDRSGMGPLSEIRALKGLARIVRSVKPDIVHSFRLKPALYGGVGRWLSGRPASVSTITGLGWSFTETANWRTLISRAAIGLLGRVAFAGDRCRVVFQNQDDLNACVNMGLVEGRRALLVRGSGIEAGKYSRGGPAEKAGLVVLAARMLWTKGVGEFVEAARRIRAIRPSAVFRLIGGTDALNKASVPEAQLRSWVAEGVVEWTGHVSDVGGHLSEASVVCLPSYREGLPKVLLEAGLLGKAIVTCDTPGCREIIQHERNGLLVPPRDSAALAETILRYLGDSELRMRLGENVRGSVLAEYTDDFVLPRTMAIYRSLLSPGEGDSACEDANQRAWTTSLRA